MFSAYLVVKSHSCRVPLGSPIVCSRGEPTPFQPDRHFACFRLAAAPPHVPSHEELSCICLRKQRVSITRMPTLLQLLLKVEHHFVLVVVEKVHVNQSLYWVINVSVNGIDDSTSAPDSFLVGPPRIRRHV